MMKGFYTAASGSVNRSHAINTIGNNIANSNTSAFKKDDVILKTFGEEMTYKLSNKEGVELGGTNSGVVIDEIYTQFQQGDLHQTNDAFNMALFGEGFFSVQLEDQSTAYTRNNYFNLNQDGYLTDLQGNLLLSDRGPIQIGNSSFSVSPTGEIFSEGKSLGTLQLRKPANEGALKKFGELLYIPEDGTQMEQAQAVVRQGYIEASNVDMIKEMADLIENSRSFQSCSQIMKMMDRIMEQTVNEIARL